MAMGRPSLLEDDLAAERVDILIRAVKNGMSIKGACRLAQLGHSNVREWIEKGEADNAPEHYADFADRLAKARAEREQERVDAIKAAGFVTKDGTFVPDWRAQAFLLERQEPSDYGARQYIEQETTHTIKALEITGAPLPELEP